MLTYIVTVIVLAPWLLLLVGAIQRLQRRSGRLMRLQVEGAALALVSMLSRWVIFDPNFGLDRLGEQRWSYWFARGERGLFILGLLLFGLGYFLSRRPHPGLRPWSVAARTVSGLAILGGCVLAIVAWRAVALPPGELPWGAARIVFTLGCVPFALLYFLRGRARNENGDISQEMVDE